jgi:FKBP-type peptidyl-prolyl cis-trans isomerase FkpA
VSTIEKVNLVKVFQTAIFMNKRMYLLVLLVGMGIIFGCKKDEESMTVSQMVKIDTVEIKNYLATNNLTATKHTSGLYYIIHEVGEGPNINMVSEVNIKYDAKYLKSGEAIAESNSYTTLLADDGYLPSLRFGLPLIKKGGRMTMYVPRSLTSTAHRKEAVIINVEVKEIY